MLRYMLDCRLYYVYYVFFRGTSRKAEIAVSITVGYIASGRL